MDGVGTVETGDNTVAAGDFDDFYQREYRPLLRLALVLSGSPNGADDLVQETMLRAYRHWSKVANYERPGAWARRVLCNLAVSRSRKLLVEARGLVRMRAQRGSEEPPSDEDVWSAVRALPKREAQVIALFYVEDLSVGEIAAVLDCAEGRVKSLLHRGRQRLATQLGEVDE